MEHHILAFDNLCSFLLSSSAFPFAFTLLYVPPPILVLFSLRNMGFFFHLMEWCYRGRLSWYLYPLWLIQWLKLVLYRNLFAL